MKFLSIHPEGGKKMKSVHVASVAYKNEDGNKKIVPVFSRRPIEKEADLEGYVAGVAVIVIDDSDKNDLKLLLTKEFRLAVNREVIGIPTGIPNKGESVLDAAAREVKEETGLTVIPQAQSNPLYINPAESNEMIIVVEAHIPATESKEIKKSDNANEEVNAFWAGKKEIFAIKYDKTPCSLLASGVINEFFT